jgi:hypothetical protein
LKFSWLLLNSMISGRFRFLQTVGRDE